MNVAASAATSLLGGVAGAQKDVVSGSGSQGNVSTVQVTPASKEETEARQRAFDAFKSLDARIQSIERSGALSNLDKLLQELGQGPSEERIQQAGQLGEQLFAPQQTQLNQALEFQRERFANTAAQMGRSSSDPILAAKLAQEQVRQQQQLNAEKGAFVAGEAINAPSRLFQNQLTGLAGLSAQAIQNRQAVFSLGSDFTNMERNFRLNTATRTGRTDSFQSQESGGGFKGFAEGFLGGASAGVKMFGAPGGGGR